LQAILCVLVLDLICAQLQIAQRAVDLPARCALARDFCRQLLGLVAVVRVECGAE
jgi:hypothetical protein